MVKGRSLVGAVCLTVMLVASASTSWAAIIYDFGNPQDYTLSAVIAAGGIKVGDKLFDNFQVTTNKSTGAVAPDASGISVRGVLQSGDYGLRFNGGWSAAQNQIADSTIKYKVTADDPFLIKDNTLMISAFGAVNGGIVSVSENLYLQNPDVVINPPIANELVYYVSATNQGLVSSGTFSPTASVWVVKDVIANGGVDPNGLGHLSEFYQTFSQVPEPATMAVLAAGALLALRRRRA